MLVMPDGRYDTGDGILDFADATDISKSDAASYSIRMRLNSDLRTTRTYAGQDDAQTPDMKENEFAGSLSPMWAERMYVLKRGHGLMCTATD